MSAIDLTFSPGDKLDSLADVFGWLIELARQKKAIAGTTQPTPAHPSAKPKMKKARAQ